MNHCMMILYGKLLKIFNPSTLITPYVSEFKHLELEKEQDIV